MRHLRNVRLTARRLPAVGLLALALAAAGCEDELNNPESFECDEVLEIAIVEVPVTLEYRVAAGGQAVVESVTYTTPTGDVTTMDIDHDAANDIVFQHAEEFDEPTEATLRARGEIAAGGQIGISYTIFSDAAPVAGPISVCGG